MNYRNLGLLVIALVLSAGAGGIWVAYLNAMTNTPKATNADNSTTTSTIINETQEAVVSIESDTSTLNLNDSMDVNIKLDSQGFPIKTLALVLKFDPAVIRLNSIAGTGLFDLYLGDTVDPIKGFLTMTGSTIGEKSVFSDPTFMRINISRISDGDTKLTVAHPTTNIVETSAPYTQVFVETSKSFSIVEKSLNIN